MPLWLLKVGKFFTSSLGVYVLIGVAVLIGLGLWGHARYSAGYKAGSAKIQAAWDKEKSTRQAAADAHNAQAGMVSADVGAKAEAAQVVIQTRYRTLVQKVPQYVPVQTPPGVIRGDDRVPVGALVLLDAAARGDDPDAVSVTSGRSYELASPVRFTEFVGGYVENLGIGHQNAAQLTGLQSWTRAQQALNRPD